MDSFLFDEKEMGKMKDYRTFVQRIGNGLGIDLKEWNVDGNACDSRRMVGGWWFTGLALAGTWFLYLRPSRCDWSAVSWSEK